MYMCLCGHIFSFLWCQYLGLEQLGNRINVCITFLKNYQLFSIMVVRFYGFIHSIYQMQLPHIFYKIGMVSLSFFD